MYVQAGNNSLGMHVIFLLLQLHKIFQNLKSYIAALLRMKLTGKYIIFFYGSVDRRRIISSSAAFR